jgi:hypothetical protein
MPLGGGVCRGPEEVNKQDPVDRDHAFELVTQWLDEVCDHVAAWEVANPSDPLRRPLHSLIKRILETCKGASTLTKAEQCEQAGALLRVAIENLWLVDLLGSDHPRAEETLEDWIGGKKLQSVSVRKMIAEEFGDGDIQETALHREFLDAIYAELCAFIHPRAASPSASTLERGLFVILTSVLGCLPVCLSKFCVMIPSELIRRGHALVAVVSVLLTAHLPEELRQEVADFANAMIAAATEDDYDEE